MKPLGATTPLSPTNLLLALQELDKASAHGALPAFVTEANEDGLSTRTLGSTLEMLGGDSSAAGVRDKLLRALNFVLNDAGLPHEFATFAVEALRNASPAAEGVIRNRIQSGFETLAKAIENKTAVREGAVGPPTPGRDFGSLGWDRIGTSCYWRCDDSVGVAKPGQCPTTLAPYRVVRDESVTGVSLTESDIYFRLRPRNDRDSGLRTMHLSGSTSSANGIYDDAKIAKLNAFFDGKGAADSLRAAAFVEIAPDVFERVVGDNHSRYEVLAFVEGDRITDVYKSDTRKAHPLLGGGSFNLLGVRGGHYEDALVCKIENVAMGIRFEKGGGSFSNPIFSRPLDSFSPEQLGISTPYLPHSEASGFVVGGTNSTAAIRACRSFNSIAVDVLESGMRPEQMGAERSHAGFLQANESLIDEMAFANDFVVGEKGSSHQAVAKHLRYFEAAYRLGVSELEYHGVTYRLSGHPAFGGLQDSPFSDGSGGGGGFYLSRKDTPDQKVLVSPTAIDMIERWGFYEGRGCDWHVSPVALFDMLAPAFASDT